jgi:hypothetical protein
LEFSLQFSDCFELVGRSRTLAEQRLRLLLVVPECGIARKLIELLNLSF